MPRRPPRPLLLASEITVGEHHDLGEHPLDSDEVVAFASRWDPLPMHLDQVVARASIFGGLAASGMHTLAILQRLSVQGVYRDWRLLAGRRLSDTRFVAPAFAGTTLGGTLVVESVRERGPGRPAVVTNHSRLTCDGATLLDLRVEVLVATEPPR